MKFFKMCIILYQGYYEKHTLNMIGLSEKQEKSELNISLVSFRYVLKEKCLKDGNTLPLMTGKVLCLIEHNTYIFHMKVRLFSKGKVIIKPYLIDTTWQ